MEIREILAAHNFRYDKSLGQNFITDTNLLKAIVSDAGITSGDTVVEIGAGAGTLTKELAKAAKEVIAFEVDENLRPVLGEVLGGLSNVRVEFGDVLKMSDRQFREIVPQSFKVVANLPYYITTPLIMRFVESGLPYIGLTLTVQKEVAERLAAVSGTPEYGAITASINLTNQTKLLRHISKNMFYPVPKVDSALIGITMAGNRYGADDVAFVRKVIKLAFMWRRKTLANNLHSALALPKEKAEEILTELGFEKTVRGERLSAEDFCRLAKMCREQKTL